MVPRLPPNRRRPATTYSSTSEPASGSRRKAALLIFLAAAARRRVVAADVAKRIEVRRSVPDRQVRGERRVCVDVEIVFGELHIVLVLPFVIFPVAPTFEQLDGGSLRLDARRRNRGHADRVVSRQS